MSRNYSHGDSNSNDENNFNNNNDNNSNNDNNDKNNNNNNNNNNFNDNNYHSLYYQAKAHKVYVAYIYLGPQGICMHSLFFHLTTLTLIVVYVP